MGGRGISLAHGCIVEEVHKGVLFHMWECYDVCGMQTNNSVTYLFTYIVNSVIDMCTVYSVHVNLYCIVYTIRLLPSVFDSVLYVYAVQSGG